MQFAGAEPGEATRALAARAGQGRSGRFPARSTCTSTSALDEPGARPADGPHAAAAARADAQSTSARTCWSRSSGSSQTAPAFWLNPQNGVVYTSRCRRRSTSVDSLDALLNMPVAAPARGSGGTPQLLGNLVEVAPSAQLADRHRTTTSRRRSTSTPACRAPTSASVAGAGADSSSTRCGRSCRAAARSRCAARSRRMQRSFIGLGVGLAMAIVLVYLLIVVNFQSWLDPFDHHRGAAGGARRHRVDAVHHRHDAERAGADGRDHDASASRPRTASCWSRSRASSAAEGATPLAAALEAGATRIRPVLMTALAMIIGMIPMALGLGEGGEQNAPLGRAVIGGLLFATVSTLFFVPVVYAGVHRRLAAPRAHARGSHGRRRRTAAGDLSNVASNDTRRRHPRSSRRRGRRCEARPDRGARRSLAVVVLVLLAVGAGRTVFSRMSNARDARGRRGRAAQAVRARRRRRRPAARARRSRCPARCRASCRRRSRRARAATCKRWHKDIGSRVKQGRAARRDRDARRSTSSSRRRWPRASRPRRAWTLAQEHARALGERCARRTSVSQQELDERRSADAQARANLAAADANVERLQPARRLQARASRRSPA